MKGWRLKRWISFGATAGKFSWKTDGKAPTRIGFQSLLHDSFYRPQYATLRDGDPDRMDYIVTGGTHFIEAERIDLLFARAEVERIIAPQVHQPGQASR